MDCCSFNKATVSFFKQFSPLRLQRFILFKQSNRLHNWECEKFVSPNTSLLWFLVLLVFNTLQWVTSLFNMIMIRFPLFVINYFILISIIPSAAIVKGITVLYRHYRHCRGLTNKCILWPEEMYTRHLFNFRILIPPTGTKIVIPDKYSIVFIHKIYVRELIWLDVLGLFPGNFGNL